MPQCWMTVSLYKSVTKIANEYLIEYREDHFQKLCNQNSEWFWAGNGIRLYLNEIAMLLLR